MPSKSDKPDDIFELARKLEELDFDSPEADAILDQMAEIPRPPEPPALFLIAGDPKISFDEFKAQAINHLGCEFEGGNLILPAVRSGKLERVKWLVEQGLDPHQINDSGYSPLLKAMFIRGGRRCDSSNEILGYFIGLGCSLDQTSSYGESALSVSIRRGNYAHALDLIRKGANPELIGFSLLHQAAAAGDLERINRFAPSSDLEGRDYLERTPWLTAIAADHWEAAVELVRLGSKQNVKGHLDTTPLALCAQVNAINCVRYLLEQSPTEVSLRKNLDELNDFGDSLLHEAVAAGSLDIARLLLEKGASLEIKNSVGEKPVNDAQSLAMFQLLHNFGADLDHVDGCGEWPLKVAAENDDLEAVRWLLAQGVSVDRTSTGATALFGAARRASHPLIRELIEAGADLNRQDVDGDSVLFCCANVETAKFLLAAGVDPSLTNQIGETAAEASYVSKEVRDYLNKFSKRKR